jgi:probable addiction module antidote protein
MSTKRRLGQDSWNAFMEEWMEITKWDAADYLNTPEDVAGYLDAAQEDGDPELLKHALEDVARAQERLAKREAVKS